MEYRDEDIEFADRILTCRDELEDEEAYAWMANLEHLMLLDELAKTRDPLSVKKYERMKAEVFARLKRAEQDRKSRRMTLRWSVAASIVLLIGLCVSRVVNEWRDLDDTRALARGEEMVYGKNDELIFNTLKVNEGELHRLRLADGTGVWLNSMTEFRYPVTFLGDERKVYLAGEAYFEVSRDEAHPFVVAVDDVDVKVYGTAFNINARHRGRIQVVHGKGEADVRVQFAGEEVVLQPDQVAEYVASTRVIGVTKVDFRALVAWKNGELVFEQDTIE